MRLYSLLGALSWPAASWLAQLDQISAITLSRFDNLTEQPKSITKTIIIY